MATLYSLRTSITLLPHEAALALIKDIRAKRRRVREEKAAAFVAKEEAKKVRKKQNTIAQLATSISDMSEEALEAMLIMMKDVMQKLEENNSGTPNDQMPSS